MTVAQWLASVTVEDLWHAYVLYSTAMIFAASVAWWFTRPKRGQR